MFQNAIILYGSSFWETADTQNCGHTQGISLTSLAGLPRGFPRAINRLPQQGVPMLCDWVPNQQGAWRGPTVSRRWILYLSSTWLVVSSWQLLWVIWIAFLFCYYVSVQKNYHISAPLPPIHQIVIILWIVLGERKTIGIVLYVVIFQHEYCSKPMCGG